MNKTLFTGAMVVILLVLVAILAPFIAPYDPSAIDQANLLAAPSSGHWLGTDSLGRDILSRMIYGARISLSVALIAVGIATLVGMLAGAVAGFYGGWVDAAIMRLVDVMLCFPTFFLILAVVAILESSIFNIMVIIGLTSWMGTARLVRSEILSLKEQEFVQAAQATGCSNRRIIVRHLLPHAIGPVLVSATLGVGSAILLESGLSFLGLGVQPPVPSWGNILTESKSTMGVAWWLTLFPGLAILITILSFNLIAEGLKKEIG